jgi:hypothetical protein
MQVPTDALSMWEWALRSGNTGALVLVGWIGLKINAKLSRDESLKRDYPPHRHVNGTKILYPDEYQPSPIERLQ